MFWRSFEEEENFNPVLLTPLRSHHNPTALTPGKKKGLGIYLLKHTYFPHSQLVRQPILFMPIWGWRKLESWIALFQKRCSIRYRQQAAHTVSHVDKPCLLHWLMKSTRKLKQITPDCDARLIGLLTFYNIINTGTSATETQLFYYHHLIFRLLAGSTVPWSRSELWTLNMCSVLTIH